MSVYVVRHGQTDWNKAGAVQGRYDVPLNDTGREQARVTGEELKDVEFFAAFASPLQRARETAEIILGDRATPLNLDQRLVEMAYGDYEGSDWRDPEYQRLRRTIAYRFPGGENYFDIAYRAYSFLEEKRPLAEKGNILIVCHGAIGRVIRSYFEDDVNNDDFIDQIAPNGVARVYEYPTRDIPYVVPNPVRKF